MTNSPSISDSSQAVKRRIKDPVARHAAELLDEEDEHDKGVRANSIEVEMQPLKVSDDDDEVNGDGLYAPSTSLVIEGDDSWRQQLEDFLFPPHLPRSCQLLRPENIAIPACYLLVGLLQGLSSPLINVFPQDLGATEAQQTSVSSIRSLPSSFKLIFGFLSDNVPIAGYRRKPYMFLGWFVASFSMLMLMQFSNLTLDTSTEGCFGLADDEPTSRVPADAPSIAFLSICLLGFGIGFWLADVMGDSIVAEKAKLEPDSSRGSVQSSCYSYRFFGMMIAAPLATYLYSYAGPYYVILLLGSLPMLILPLVYFLHEDTETPIRSTPDQCREIWNTVCSRAVWQPMAFIYLYNVMQVSNSAWKEFLVSTLHFTKCQLNLILIVTLVLLYLGILCYKYFMIHWSWRKVYIWTTFLNGFLSLLQVLLIMGVTFGMSNFFFALGDDAFSEFISGIQFLPNTIMMVHLCPAGSEGASYAMFTTVNNSALTMSSALSTMLLGIWDVRKETLKAGNMSGMINLTYLTTAIQVSAIAFVGMLPHYKEELIELGRSPKSALGGTIFLTITFLSISYAVIVSAGNILFPGWMGES